MNNRITPDNIINLKENEIFVFGSNLAGKHGLGAARLAKQKFGAIYGKGWGPQGNSWAIPTKDWQLKTLTLKQIETQISLFILFAKHEKSKIFLVTKIGCGLAGYTPEDIAPMFKDVVNVENVYLPQEFFNIIEEMN